MNRLPTRPKILFFTQSAYTRGGIETWLDRICPMLERVGWDVTVGLTSGKHFHNARLYSEEHPLLRTVAVDVSHPCRDARVAAVKQTLLTHTPDVTVVFALVDALTGASELKSSGFSTRLVCIAHGVSPGPFYDYKRYSGSIDAAAAVGSLGCMLFERLVQIDRDRIFHIRNGAAVRSSRERVDHSESINLSYVGRFDFTEKRVQDLVYLLRRLDSQNVQYKCRVAGDGPARQHLLKELQPQLDLKKLEILGWLNADDLDQKIYSWADIILLFSPAEGSCPPIAVAEAMHSGVVPAVSCFRGLRCENLLRDYENAIIYPVEDIDSLATRISDLWMDRSLLSRLSKNALDCARGNLDLESLLPQWHGFFRNVISRDAVVGPPVKRTQENSGVIDKLPLPRLMREKLRALIGREYRPLEPGGEWPHCSQYDSQQKQDFLGLCDELDKVPRNASGIR